MGKEVRKKRYAPMAVYVVREMKHMKKFFFYARFMHDRLVEPRYDFYLKATRWSNGRFSIKNLLNLRGTIYSM